MNYTRFSNTEWDAIQRKAKGKWLREVLGDRPTRKDIEKGMENPFKITWLEWTIILVLLVLGFVTSIKVGVQSQPFAISQINSLAANAYLPEWVREAFLVGSAVLFALMATPAVIYFKLLDESKRIQEQKSLTRSVVWYKRWQLHYLSPRLPAGLVYTIVLWLIYVSSHGDGSVFEKYIPVAMEVALAMFVGMLMSKQVKKNQFILDALELKTKPYDGRLSQYLEDPDYLRILYQIMRESLIKLRRSGRHPNSDLETADLSQIDGILRAEYKRLTSGHAFADFVKAEQQEIAVAPEPAEKRVPPHGASEWTSKTLAEDFKLRLLSPKMQYRESDLAVDYAAGYKARAAFRSGAKKYFA